MQTLPDDIVHYNILTRVEAKSLVRFKCVSKTWYNLFKSSIFNRIHQKHALKLHNSTDFIIGYSNPFERGDDGWFCSYIDASDPLIARDVAIKIDHFDTTRLSNTAILGSCNGLISLLSSALGITLYNPLTKESRRLINPLRSPNRYGWSSRTCKSYGFGYDCIGNHYKIFIISSVTSTFDDMTTLHDGMVQVYSTRTNSWRKVGSIDLSILVYENGVVVNNKLHWVYSDAEAVGCKNNCKILTCDLHTEEYELGSMQFPSTNIENFVSYLMVSGGLLYAIMSRRSNSDDSLWVMKEYGVSDSWVKVVDFEGNSIIRVLTYRPGKEGGEALLMKNEHESRQKKFEWHNFGDKSTKNVEISPDSQARLVSVESWACISSLTPIPRLTKILSAP